MKKQFKIYVIFTDFRVKRYFQVDPKSISYENGKIMFVSRNKNFEFDMDSIYEIREELY